MPKCPDEVCDYKKHLNEFRLGSKCLVLKERRSIRNQNLGYPNILHFHTLIKRRIKWRLLRMVAK